MVLPSDSHVIGEIIIDGELYDPARASLSVLDIGLQRGYGCFEALRSYSGKPFRSAAHYQRLQASAETLHIALPADGLVEDWVASRSAAAGDCVVRVIVTGGLDPFSPGDSSHVVVFAERVPDGSGPLRVAPIDAPWHPDGSFSELAGAKTLSYGPNLAATLAARRDGYDDAVLIGRSGSVLEGPTYGLAWVVDGMIETPSLDLHILASITRAAMLEVAADQGFLVSEGRFPIDRVLAADEVFALSTVKEIKPVAALGDRRWEAGPVTERLGSAFRELVRTELAEG